MRAPQAEDDVCAVMTKDVQLVTGQRLLFNQMRAIFLKKSVVARRGWLLLLILVIAPAFVLLYTYFVVHMSTSVEMLPELSMLPETWKNKKTVIAVGSGDKSMAKNYRDLATDSTWTVILLDNETSPSDAFEKRMLEQYSADKGEVREAYYVGASFEETQITGWFNNYPYHSVPLALNMLYNAHLKSSGISLNIVNHPLPYTAKTQ
ncbi:ATP-binding cassette sub-family A member 3, partial [Gryllus bimaculatus]